MHGTLKVSEKTPRNRNSIKFYIVTPGICKSKATITEVSKK
jgi:hypothetical protein